MKYTVYKGSKGNASLTRDSTASSRNYHDSHETHQLFGHSLATCAKSTSVYSALHLYVSRVHEFSFEIRRAEGGTKTNARPDRERGREKEDEIVTARENGRERDRRRKRRMRKLGKQVRNERQKATKADERAVQMAENR